MTTPGRKDAFEKYAAELSVATRAEVGCHFYHLHRNLNQKGSTSSLRNGPPDGSGNSTCPAKPSASSTRNCPREQSPTSRSIP
nr:antibiotic biosynthesis monooxygenase [Ensifer sp. ENS08]